MQRPKRITSQEVSKESREAVDAVGSSLNTFMEESYITMMGNLTVGDNLNMSYTALNIIVDSNGIPKAITRFKSNINTKTIGLLVVNVAPAPDSAPFLSFTENSGLVTITGSCGLLADTQYQLVILTLGQ